MGIHEVEHLTDAVVAYEGVGIEQQHIVALGLTNGEVVAFGKAQVVVAVDDGDG